MSDEVKDLEFDNPSEMSVDKFLRITIGQLFENDNDTTYLYSTLKAADGSTAEVEWKLKVVSSNGVKTREEEEDGKAA